jgi:hypothetical protein
VFNLTATEARATGYLTLWPSSLPRPGTPSLNFFDGRTVANTVVTAADGGISVANLVLASVSADGTVRIAYPADGPGGSAVAVIVDVVGWFASP